MYNHLLSDLEKSLILKMSNTLYNFCNSEIITKDDIIESQQMLSEAEDKLSICSSIETLRYCFSVILSEIRQRKRDLVTVIFEQKPKIAEEKSVLEKKLDAIPEYAEQHKYEELLFQFIEHLDNVKNNVNWLIKEGEE